MPSLEDIGDLREWLRSKVRVGKIARELAREFGYRPYMIERFRELLGSWLEVREILEAFERGLNPFIRCNRLKVRDCREVVERLRKADVLLRGVSWCSNCFEVYGGGGKESLGYLHEHLLGMYYLYRGPASLIPPLTLNPERVDSILDLAAAPGGKTTHIAELMGNEGRILAVDISRARMRALRSNVERLGVTNTVLLRIDGRLVPELFRDFFSKVLLDAPCTGEGLIAIDVGRKVRSSLNDLLRVRELQIELLKAGVESVRPGGLILYSTCSIAPEEDELVVAELLRYGKVKVVPRRLPLRFREGLTHYFGLDLPNVLRGCSRLYPHISGSEGFFTCLLRRVG